MPLSRDLNNVQELVRPREGSGEGNMDKYVEQMKSFCVCVWWEECNNLVHLKNWKDQDSYKLLLRGEKYQVEEAGGRQITEELLRPS